MTNKIENAVANTATKPTNDTAAAQLLEQGSSSLKLGDKVADQEFESENQFWDEDPDAQTPEMVRESLLARFENMKSEGFDPIVMDIGAERKSLPADEAKLLIKNMHAEDLNDIRIINGW